jgi:hypothetical protein
MPVKLKINIFIGLFLLSVSVSVKFTVPSRSWKKFSLLHCSFYGRQKLLPRVCQGGQSPWNTLPMTLFRIPWDRNNDCLHFINKGTELCRDPWPKANFPQTVKSNPAAILNQSAPNQQPFTVTLDQAIGSTFVRYPSNSFRSQRQHPEMNQLLFSTCSVNKAQSITHT